MDLVIRNAISDTTGEPIEIGITNGVITAIASAGLPAGTQEIDAEGGMLSPAFLESHFHLENALLWDGVINQSGTLHEAIELYAEVKKRLTVDDIVNRAGLALRAAAANGTLWLRSHVDIDHIAKLSILRGVVAARERFAHLVTIQLVAFPQLGMARNPEAVEMMWQALENGCDLVGGMPHGERDMDDAARQIELAFEMAQHYDVDVDMPHRRNRRPVLVFAGAAGRKNHRNRPAGSRDRPVTAARCRPGDDALAERVIDKVKQAEIHIVTNAPINLMLEGRGHGYPKPRGIARVKQLLEAGVNVVLRAG